MEEVLRMSWTSRPLNRSFPLGALTSGLGLAVRSARLSLGGSIDRLLERRLELVPLPLAFGACSVDSDLEKDLRRGMSLSGGTDVLEPASDGGREIDRTE
jgi:hypothetical protein